uniref:Actin, cytoplasmic n=1 Tax=Arion vulgaris TaxID=1028688 RepID=A0A0B7B8M4_9EUPU
MSVTNVIPVLMDIGSDTCKVGFSGDQNPRNIVPSVVGHRQTVQSVGVDTVKRNCIGQDALDEGDALTLKYPIERGVITDWENMEILWDYIYQKKLTALPTDHPVLVTDTPNNPKENREKMAEILFEKFNVPAFFSSCQAVLCLYSAGRCTGLVLDVGSDVTSAVPVYEGYSLSESIVRTNFAGKDITQYLLGLLSDRGFQFTTASEKSHVKIMKEKLCYVSQDFDKDMTEFSKSSHSAGATYQLPDGKTISLGTERFKGPELLFQPSISEKNETKGIHEMINKAILACELDTRKSLYTNVILSGGGSLFDGIVERLKKELKSFGTLGAEARVHAPKDRILSAWTGGSVLTSLPFFEKNWISRKDYQESGPQVVNTRCF